MARNNVLSICKGLGIILVVMGHAEPPDLISNFIYIFHMPLFFIAAGYFFSRKNAENPWEFCTRRFRGLYVPFVMWSLVFLLLHNLWFELGLLNEQFGNWKGGVTHPYTLHQVASRFFMILTSMSGYDEFMAGAFWFFRGLLIASIMFMVLFRLADSRLNRGDVISALAVCVLVLAVNAFRLGNGLKISTIPNGGLRETWGIFFFGIGVVYNRLESRIGTRWWVSLLSLSVLCVGAWQHWCGMNNSGQLQDLVTLPVTGIAGFLFIRHLSALICSAGGLVSRLLVYIGNNTLYVFILHIISYKVVSAVKIAYYDLDPGQIGCHMVIHYNNHKDLFWILYTIVGTALPLIAVELWRRRSALVRFAARLIPLRTVTNSKIE